MTWDLNCIFHAFVSFAEKRRVSVWRSVGGIEKHQVRNESASNGTVGTQTRFQPLDATTANL